MKCMYCLKVKGCLIKVQSYWVHIECVKWIPEITFDKTKSSIKGTIDPNRCKLPCLFCSSYSGYSLQCEEVNCSRSFHVTCAIQNGIIDDETIMKGAFENPYFREKEVYIFFCNEHKKKFIEINNNIQLKCNKNNDGKSTIIKSSSVSAFKRQHRPESINNQKQTQIMRDQNGQCRESIHEDTNAHISHNKAKLFCEKERNDDRNLNVQSNNTKGRTSSQKFKIREKRESKLDKKAEE